MQYVELAGWYNASEEWMLNNVLNDLKLGNIDYKIESKTIDGKLLKKVLRTVNGFKFNN